MLADSIAASRPLTVVQVVPDLQPGNAGQTAVQVTEALTQHGHRTIVVTEGGRMESELARAGAVIRHLPVATKNPSQIFANGRALAELARETGADLLHAQSRAPAWSCLLARRLCRVPYVTTYNNNFREQNALKRLYNSAMVRGSKVIALGDRIANLIESRYGTPRDKIAVVDRCVDLSRFDLSRVSEERREALARNWSLEPGARIVLLPGRLTKRKGPHVLVDAALKLREAGLKDITFIFAGEGQDGSGYAADLWDRVHQAGLSGLIRFVGHCPDMPAAYSLADIAVTTVLQPGGPQRAVLEAQAMKTPVVVSDGEERGDILLASPFAADTASTGLLYPAGNPAELAQALFKLLAMGKPARTAMGERGRAFVSSRFPEQAFVDRMLAVYAEVAAERRNRQPAQALT
jgi:glycosyltransferase involved in cell wall biosynthesis